MRVGSLFTGIGGFDIGFERAGHEIVFQCELDSQARKVLAKHWPEVPCYEDVRQVGASNAPLVDVLIGGFPCQDVSYANGSLRGEKGLEGARSGLWREFARVVDELRPGYAVIENVGALRTRGLEEVLNTLHALGYDAEWDTLSAAEFGLPHYRDRLFILATARLIPRMDLAYCECQCGDLYCEPHDAHFTDCPCRGIQGEVECGGCNEWWNLLDSPSCDRCGWNPPDALRERAQVSTGGSLPTVSFFSRDSTTESTSRRVQEWATESCIYRGNDGLSRGLDGRWIALKQLGNAVCPPVAEWIGRRLKAMEEV